MTAALISSSFHYQVAQQKKTGLADLLHSSLESDALYTVLINFVSSVDSPIETNPSPRISYGLRLPFLGLVHYQQLHRG